MKKISTRRAQVRDLAAITAVQLESWRRTYNDVLPEDYRGAPMERDLTALWTPDRLQRDLVLVAEVEGQIAGLSGIILEDGATAYLDNLHVAQRFEGMGVGRALMATTATEVIATGRTALHLTVVTTNARALAFYEMLGGVRRAEIDDAMFGNAVRAYPIWWEGPDLPTLADEGVRKRRG